MVDRCTRKEAGRSAGAGRWLLRLMSQACGMMRRRLKGETACIRIGKDTGFQRHVRACNNATLPGGAASVPDRRRACRMGFGRGSLRRWRECPGSNASGDRVTLTDPAALPGIARDLSVRGLYRWRDEAFDVRARPEGPALTQIDRGAIPSFGIQAVGVHVNGLVCRADGLHLWIARRAMDKQLDPGKLDHIVAGGVPAGLDAGGNAGEGGRRGSGDSARAGVRGRSRRDDRYMRWSGRRGCAATGSIATT